MALKTHRSPLKEIFTGTNNQLVKEPRLDTDTITVLRFAKLTQNARTPTKGSELAAGFDLYR